MSPHESPNISRRAALTWGAALTAGVASTVGGAAPASASPGRAAAAAAPAGLRRRGLAPPEWAANTHAWPGHNYGLDNTRATTETPICARTVGRLRPAWRFPLQGGWDFAGDFTSNPIVLNDTVYLQDMNSYVFALDQHTGRLKWKHLFDTYANNGPNGVAVGWGMVFGATPTDAFALDAETGDLLWQRKLIRSDTEGIDMAPQVYDGTVIFSTVAGNTVNFDGHGMGIVWALDAWTGATKWQFNTVDPNLWGNTDLNGGGGLWFPPAVDRNGRVYLSVANPMPFPGTPDYPNGASRPGPNLYTNSLVVLDGRTGKLLWYRQVLEHDVRDYDLHLPAILTSVRVRGEEVDAVIVAGKMGKVFAFAADDGRPLWTLPLGRHENDEGPLPDELVTVFPGVLGGCETPMAVAGGRLFVPWVDLSVRMNSTTLDGTALDMSTGKGGLAAVDASTGRVLWTKDLPQMPLGAATVANDVVFTSAFTGEIYAFGVEDGRQLWTDTARAGINSFPAIAGDMLFVGAAAPAFFSSPTYELIAYKLT